MDRRSFIKSASTLGLGLYLAPWVSSCKQSPLFHANLETKFQGKVLIVGAGAAGMMAAYTLQAYGVDYQVLEASNRYGGRVKKIEGFVDFPIDLGAEWIHSNAKILDQLISNKAVQNDIELIRYQPKTLSIWRDGKLRRRNFYTNFYGELKFKKSTWFDFFEQYIHPSIASKIIYNSPVKTIDYSGSKVIATTNKAKRFEGDALILTVPLTVLKNKMIQFQPALPPSKIAALEKVEMPDGIKIFIEFSENFYPDMLSFGRLADLLNDKEGEHLYYDAAFAKDSNRHVLALFTVGTPAKAYTNFAKESDLIAFVLAELDEIFNGKASQSYLQHIVQNWNQEPYIQGSYAHFKDYSMVKELASQIQYKIFFAGEAYAAAYGYDQSTVHGAGQSAYAAVDLILKNA